MRRTPAKRFRIARQEHRRNAQRQAAVGPQQALGQPRADEPGAAGQEKALAPNRRPQFLGMGQDMVQIARQWIRHDTLSDHRTRSLLSRRYSYFAESSNILSFHVPGKSGYGAPVGLLQASARPADMHIWRDPRSEEH